MLSLVETDNSFTFTLRVGLKLEQWLLETFSAAQETATKVDNKYVTFF